MCSKGKHPFWALMSGDWYHAICNLEWFNPFSRIWSFQKMYFLAKWGVTVTVEAGIKSLIRCWVVV